MLGGSVVVFAALNDVDPTGEPVFEWTLTAARYDRGCNPIDAVPFYRLPTDNFAVLMPMDDVLAAGSTISAVAVIYAVGAGLTVGTPVISADKRSASVSISGGRPLTHHVLQFVVDLSTGDTIIINGPVFVVQ